MGVGVYFVYQDSEITVQVIDGMHIFYINNCIVIPKKLNEKYNLADYFYRYFKIVSLFGVDENIYKDIRHIKICII